VCPRGPILPNPASRAHSRTSEVDRRDRRVLLESGRQSFRAFIADFVVCGGAAPATPNPSQRRRSKGVRAEALAHARGRHRQRCPRRALARVLSLSASGPCTAAAAVCPSAPTLQSPANRARSRTSEVDRRDCRVLQECGRQSYRAVIADAGVCTRNPERESASPIKGSARRGARTRAGADAGEASTAQGARSRTSEVDRRDCRVLLESGRESFRAVIADSVVCGSAAPATPNPGQCHHSKGRARRSHTCGADAGSAARGARSPECSLHIGPLRGGRGRVPKRLKPSNPPPSTLAHF